ncbi:MAG: thiamine pyrophosphate-binding protein [Candidatus Marinimicrobia bacterium]|jgi:acetolactate synthase-1/2/3 large subunit|nr:acetolactate synthase [Candidatus Neomarinimicrobiota bacterium]MDP6339816.1 thiamine pyrophosphate-binding protein [Candidatus Neomarinimicrobiota bacterium]MDP6611604.1 thiamine pyrophosphate-binding protein [Candidatus Neomarinimicrobiota bacterium]|tara:strand:+ start:23622 stop:25364 length:1743 start_codon:yes stop_codon:yes gene_type:complete
MTKTVESHGGNIVAEVFQRHGIQWIFTLCGGHISPILTGCNEKGIRVVDVRHEATAVFAADAVSRLSGTIGVAAVTAGPGLTNTITAIKNAQMAQVPVLILGGATATVLKDRGSLQDIDHLSVVKSVIKYAKTIKRVRDIQPSLEEAIATARLGVPGPVYIEIPVDLLYPEILVRDWYGLKSKSKSMPWWMSSYLNWNVNRIFKDKHKTYSKNAQTDNTQNSSLHIPKVSEMLQSAEKPVLLIGSQALLIPSQREALADAVKELNIPTYVSGMARGLLSKSHLPIFRHERKKALKEADLVILAGVSCDFRLDYGRMIHHRAKIISINLSRGDMYLNRRPARGILTNPGSFLIELNKSNNNAKQKKWENWHQKLSERNKKRWNVIKTQADADIDYVNPLKLCLEINQHIEDGDIIVADGGDFVATASYILRPQSLSGWLDPGVFGTLGVGAGFLLGAKLTHPESVVWAIYGDGAFGYSLMEFDSFVRHKIPVIAIIGNDAGWAQIARDQVEMLDDPIGTELAVTDYHKAVEVLGGKGYFVDKENQIDDVLTQAKESAKSGKPTVVNVRIGKTDFRKGSISM